MGRIKFLAGEAVRRRVPQNTAFYIVGAWVVIQVASEAIDAGILPVLLRDVFIAAFAGFPPALLASWFYDLTRHGLERTPPHNAPDDFDRSLERKDYAILAGLAGAWILAVLVIHTPPPVERSVAILEFDNPGRDPDNELFAYGIRADLQTQLQRLGDLRVIARESSDRIDPDASLTEIRNRLGAAFVLKGSVERVFDRVRVNVALIDTDREQQAWAQLWDKDLNARSWFDVRNEITDSIVRILQAELSPDQRERSRANVTRDLNALTAYGQGLRHKDMRTIGDLAEAIENFRTALQLDPDFELAYVGLADSLYLHQLYTGAPLTDVTSEMKDLVDRALSIDPDLGEAYVTRAVVERLENGDTQAAETYFLRAIDLSPNYPVAHQWYGAFLASTDRAVEGLQRKKFAFALNPESAMLAYDVGFSMMNQGLDTEALPQFESAIRINPALPGPYERIADIHSANGRFDEAVIWQRRAVSLDPGDPYGPMFLGKYYLELGDPDRAEDWFRYAGSVAPPGMPLGSMTMEPLSLRRGDIDSATRFAEQNIRFDVQGRFTLLTLRNAGAASGDTDQALAHYEAAAPGLFLDEPRVDEGNFEMAIDLSWLLMQTARIDEAQVLLEGVRKVMGANPAEYGLNTVLFHAISGDDNEALAALERAVSDGRIEYWWIFLKLDPSLARIRPTPRFQAALERIEKAMETQLQRLRDLEAGGELEPVPAGAE